MKITHETDTAIILEHEDKTFFINKGALANGSRHIGQYTSPGGMWHVQTDTPHGDMVLAEIQRVIGERHQTEFHFTIEGVTAKQAKKVLEQLQEAYGHIGQNFGFIHLDMLKK